MAKSDPQKQLVFLMEKHELRGHYHGVYSIKKLRSYARQLARVYEVPPVKIIVRNVRGLAGEYDPNTFVIRLWPKHGKNAAILAHEFAHHIAWVRHGNRVQDHGPTFVKYFAQCMSSLRLMPVSSMRVMCKRYGVRMA